MAKKLWIIVLLVGFGFQAKAQKLENDEAAAMLRHYNFWKFTKPRMNVYIGVLDTPTSFFHIYLPDTVVKYEKMGITTVGSTWHKNTISKFRMTERIDSIIRIVDTDLVDSNTLDKFMKYYNMGYDLYCARGHFFAFEDSLQSFSGRYFGISQHYFMARLGIQASSKKLVSELVSLDSFNLLEPKQIYTGYFTFYNKKFNAEKAAIRYPFFASDQGPVLDDKKRRVLPDYRPIGMWQYRENALMVLPTNMEIAPMFWWSNNIGKLPPFIGGKQKK